MMNRGMIGLTPPSVGKWGAVIDLDVNAGYMTRSATYNSIGSGSGWSANVQYWNVSGLTAGRMYQLRFAIRDSDNAKANYVDFAACNSDDIAVDTLMSGKYSYDSEDHTFNFEAPTGASRIRATRQAGFTGTIELLHCNELVQSALYATPTPSAHQLFSHTTSLVDVMWKMEMADFADVSSPDVTGPTGGITVPTVMANVGNALTSISNASPAVVTKNSHGRSNGDRVELTTDGTLPTGLSPNVGYYVVNATTNTYELSLTSGGASINTTSAGSGSHRATSFGKTYKMSSGARSYDVTDIAQISSHNGVTIRNVRSKVYHPKLGAVYGYMTNGKRAGNFAGKVGQLNTLGDYKIEGVWVDMALDSHRNRFNNAGVSGATVTMTVADPCVLTYTAHGLNLGQPFTLATTGSLPTGVSPATTYYVLSTPTANTLTFGTSAAVGTTPVATSGSQSGTHSITIAATSNAGPVSLEGNPSNPTAKCLVANVWARNACDSIVDSKSPNAWVVNTTYDMSNGGYNVARCWMVHSYEFTRSGTYVRSGPGGTGAGTLLTITSTDHGVSVGDLIIFDFTGISDINATVDSVVDANTFTATHTTSGTGTDVVSFSNASETRGKGSMGIVGAVCPDLKVLDGFGTPFRQENKRSLMSLFNCFVGGEKIVSHAQATARGYASVVDESVFGAVTNTEFAVHKLLPEDMPAWAYWPVLKIKLQVRKNGTSPWFDVTVPYAGPFPAGAPQIQFDATAISGAGISAGNTIDVRLGHYDGINHTWLYAGADGVADYTTLTLGAGKSAELLPILAAGTTLTGVSGTNWSCPGDPAGNGYTHATGATVSLKQSSPAVPVVGADYLFETLIGTWVAQQCKPQFTGGSTVNGDNHGNTGAGTYYDELRAVTGNNSEGLLPASNAFDASGVKLSMKRISYMGDAA